MAIAVHHHHVVWCNGVVPDHFVAGGRAIGHKKAMVGVKNARRIAFALTNRTIVIQQLT